MQLVSYWNFTPRADPREDTKMYNTDLAETPPLTSNMVSEVLTSGVEDSRPDKSTPIADASPLPR
jgi:hypothetical protein